MSRAIAHTLNFSQKEQIENTCLQVASVSLSFGFSILESSGLSCLHDFHVSYHTAFLATPRESAGMGSIEKSIPCPFCPGKEIVSKGKILHSPLSTWVWPPHTHVKVSIFHPETKWRARFPRERQSGRGRALHEPASNTARLIPNGKPLGETHPWSLLRTPCEESCAFSLEGHVYSPALMHLSEYHAKHTPLRVGFRFSVVRCRGFLRPKIKNSGTSDSRTENHAVENQAKDVNHMDSVLPQINKQYKRKAGGNTKCLRKSGLCFARPQHFPSSWSFSKAH